MADITSVKLPDNSEYNLKDVVTPRIEASQPNLLINGWFTVNQRGQNSYSGSNIYTVDRWYNNTAPSSTIAVTSDGVTITASGTRTWLRQKIEFYSDLVGKTITFSIMKKDGTIYQASAVVPTPTGSDVDLFEESFDDNKIKLVAAISTSQFLVGFAVESGNTRYIRAAKLEIGSTSTLALDAPPDYSTELLKCRRYDRRYIAKVANYTICRGITLDSTSAAFEIPLSVPLRAEPTLSASALNILNGSTFYSGTINTAYSKMRGDDFYHLTVDSSSSMGAAGANVALVLPSVSDYFEMSSEL